MHISSHIFTGSLSLSKEDYQSSSYLHIIENNLRRTKSFLIHEGVSNLIPKLPIGWILFKLNLSNKRRINLFSKEILLKTPINTLFHKAPENNLIEEWSEQSE